MQQLRDLEIFEIEVLDLLNSIKILDVLYFGGGTMMRLCHNLPRYSTDLDFWLRKSENSKAVFPKIKDGLSNYYTILDSTDKFFTMLFEIKSSNLSRSLKIEIGKEQTDFDWEKKIAFSKFSNKQVLVNGLTLKQMMINKTEALLDRKLIRDCFDIEFLFIRGTGLINDKEKLNAMLKIIEGYKETDYKVTLGSILDEKDRKFYNENKFRLLKEEISKLLLT